MLIARFLSSLKPRILAPIFCAIALSATQAPALTPKSINLVVHEKAKLPNATYYGIRGNRIAIGRKRFLHFAVWYGGLSKPTNAQLSCSLVDPFEKTIGRLKPMTVSLKKKAGSTGLIGRPFGPLSRALTPGIYRVDCTLAGSKISRRFKIEQMTPSEIYQQVRRGVVLVRVMGGRTKARGRTIMRSGRPYNCRVEPSGGGSGFVVDARGYIVTNAHVVDSKCKKDWPNTPIRVEITKGEKVKSYTARIVGMDRVSDVAVIKIDCGDCKLTPLIFSNRTRPVVGETVLAVGYPKATAIGGRAPTMTRGIISATGRHSGGRGLLVQTDAPINGGNSGGPLLNAFGEVVGIAASGWSNSDGLSYAIDVRLAKYVVDQLMTYGEPRRYALGLAKFNHVDRNGKISEPADNAHPFRLAGERCDRRVRPRKGRYTSLRRHRDDQQAAGYLCRHL